MTGTINPKIEGFIASISSMTAHEVAFLPSREDATEPTLLVDVRGEDGDLYGVLQVRTANGISERELTVYAQLSAIISHEIDLRRKNLSLENRFRLLDRQNAELSALNRALSDMAYRDPLSGLYRRWYLVEQCRLELTRAMRHGRHFSLLMIDLDRFKNVNDRHGHAAGDSVLKAFSLLLQQSSRTSDVVARFGGDEFALLLTDTPLDGALEVAERIRKRCSETEFAHSSHHFRLTCSIGVGSYGPDLRGSDVTVESLLDEVDRAMYDAKENGRNLVRMVSDDIELASGE